VPSEASDGASGALGSGLAHVHLAMYPLWGNATDTGNSGSARPGSEATVTHYLALLVNLDAQLPPATHSGARGAGGGGGNGGGGGGGLLSAPHAKSVDLE
jgi:hypothetical protein